jgi:hypothetical protein
MDWTLSQFISQPHTILAACGIAPIPLSQQLLSIRQQLAHKRHHSHGQTDQQKTVLESQDGDRSESPARDDCGREVVESFLILVGCDFHASS